MFKSIMTVSLLAAAIASTSAVAADNSAGGIINFTGAIPIQPVPLTAVKARTLPLRFPLFR